MLSLNEILNTRLYDCTYAEHNNTSTTSSRYRSIPYRIIKWEDFESRLINFKNEKHLSQERKYCKLQPPTRNKYKFDDEMSVQGALEWSLFEIIRDIFSEDNNKYPVNITSNSKFKDSIVSEPDRIAWRYSNKKKRNHLLYPIEIKKPQDGDLRDEYVLSGDNKHTNSKKIIQQAVGYMYRNQCTYSIITTYRETYALHLQDDGSVFITRPFKYYEIKPTIIEIFWYITHLAIVAKPYTGIILENGHTNPSNLRFNNVNDASDINITNIVEQSGGKYKKIYSGKILNKDVYIKIADTNTPQYINLKREIDVYLHLKDLQGKSIPRLLYYGQNDDKIYLITQKVGKSLHYRGNLKNILEYIKKSIDILHSFNVYHGDLEPRNLLLSGKKIYIIDFEHSIIGASSDLLMSEKNNFQKLI